MCGWRCTRGWRRSCLGCAAPCSCASSLRSGRASRGPRRPGCRARPPPSPKLGRRPNAPSCASRTSTCIASYEGQPPPRAAPHHLAPCLFRPAPPRPDPARPDPCLTHLDCPPALLANAARRPLLLLPASCTRLRLILGRTVRPPALQVCPEAAAHGTLRGGCSADERGGAGRVAAAAAECAGREGGCLWLWAEARGRPTHNRCGRIGDGQTPHFH